MKRVLRCWLLIALLIGAVPHTAQAQARCFADVPGIAACLDWPFAGYWTTNGGLPVFGYPITGPNMERNPDLGRDVLTQWTERNRLEVHPENQAPYSLLLGRMGAERLTQAGRDPAAEGRESGPQAGCLWFAATAHNVCDQAPGVGFKSYWQGHGLALPGLNAYDRSLQLFGLPLTAPREEKNAAGDTVLTQWFERARFEWHPKQPAGFKVLLGLLGNELRSNGQTVRRTTSPFGVEISQSFPAGTADRVRETRAGWVRYNGVNWATVEPQAGQRNWAALGTFETHMTQISATGATPLVIIRGAPVWAQQTAGSQCGPIRREALANFASFVGELVKRYSAPPFNVHFWELGNEPDVDPQLVSGDVPFGCWGNSADRDYGGGYYAEMLKAIYPAVKQADPTSQVVLGGLLLDCDPANPVGGKDCTPARFLEGVLRNGGGAAFDVLAYHAYTYWSNGAKDWDLAIPDWQVRGGMLLGKLDYLHEVMDRYAVIKPILMNEGGLLCYPTAAGCPQDRLAAAQANYAVRLFVRGWANGLAGTVWYTLTGPGWREGGLLDAQQNPRPAFRTTTLLSTLLGDATFLGRLDSGTAEGYLFGKNGTRFAVYWTNSATPAEVPMLPGARTIYNLAGQPTPATGDRLTVTFEPVIVATE